MRFYWRTDITRIRAIGGSGEKAGKAQLPEIAEVRRILERRNKQKPKAENVAALHKRLEEVPGLRQVAGDMARIAEIHLIDTLNATADVKEPLRFSMTGTRRKVGGETATSLEKILIRHVVLCRVLLQLSEYRQTDRINEGGILDQGDYWECRLSAVQHRYLRACETLARIRRMGLPTMRVNVGEDQVNVAGGSGLD